MAKAKKSPVAKSAVVEKSIVSSLETLAKVCKDAERAVTVRAAEVKKLMLQMKRLSKRKVVLSKRKKTLAEKNKKAPAADLKKQLRETEKELNAAKKDYAKLKVSKQAASEELANLRAHLKRVTAYMKVIKSADKALEKPKKKKRVVRKAA